MIAKSCVHILLHLQSLNLDATSSMYTWVGNKSIFNVFLERILVGYASLIVCVKRCVCVVADLQVSLSTSKLNSC